MARRIAAKHKIHKAVRKVTKRRAGTLARAGAFLALPIPDAELAVAALANPDSGIKFVLGIAKRAGKRASEVQSILFDKLKWTADAAKGWLRDHGFVGTGKDEGATFWRFRQQSPGKYKEFRTIVPGTRNPRYEHPAPARDWKSPVNDWTIGPYSEYSPAHEKAMHLKSQGHHIRQISGPTEGRWEIVGFSYGDIPEAAVPSRPGFRNPLKFGDRPYDLSQGATGRYHVVDEKGYIRWKSNLGITAYDHAGNLSDREPGLFQVIDTRDGSVYGSYRGGEPVEGNPRLSVEKTWARQEREQYGPGRYQVSIHHPAVPTRVLPTLAEAKALVKKAKSYAGSAYDIYDRQGGKFLESGFIGRTGNPQSRFRRANWVYLVPAEYRFADRQLAEIGLKHKVGPEEMHGGVVQKAYKFTNVAGSKRFERLMRNMYWIERDERLGREGNPEVDVADAITSYDEHLGMTTRSEFQEATPDEQAAAMTAMDLAENPVPSVADGPGLHVVHKQGEYYAYANGKYLWRHHDPEQLTMILKREWGWDWDGNVEREAWEKQNPLSLRDRLVHTVTEYDRKQEGKRGYNRYAIGHYLNAVSHVMEEVDKGYSVRSAINNNFTGRLADVLLRAVGEGQQTREEQIGPMVREERNPSNDLGQQAFDAAKEFRLSGAYYETGVANARVAKYGFTKWYNSLPLWGRGPRPTRTHTKARLLKNWMEGWAAGKRVEKRQGNPGSLESELSRIEAGKPELAAMGRYLESRGFKGQIGGSGSIYYYDHPLSSAIGSVALMEPAEFSVHYGSGRYHKIGMGHGLEELKIAVKPFKHLKRSNPESSAAQLYESFHGRPPGETKEIVTERREHEWLTQLGVLTELKVATMTNLDASIRFSGKDSPDLCSSEDGRQLYIEGGHQELDLAALKMDSGKWLKDSMVIGVLYMVEYQTEKGFHKFQLTRYFHNLGEETGEQPYLIYDSINKLLSVSGGQYQVRDVGLVN